MGSRFGDGNITSEVILTDGAAEGGDDPRPFSTKSVDEEVEEDYRASSFDDTIDSGPEGIICEADGGEDCWRIC